MGKRPSPLKERQLFKILGALSSEEHKQFRTFLNSFAPGLKNRKRLSEIHGHILRDKVWQKEWLNTDFLAQTEIPVSPRKLDQFFSQLFYALLNFLGIREDLEQPEHSYPLAFRKLILQGIDANTLQKVRQKIQGKLEGVEEGSDFFYLKFRLDLTFAEGVNSRMLSPENRTLPLLHDDIDQFYLIHKLRLLCASEVENYIYGRFARQEESTLVIEIARERYEHLPLLAKIYFHAIHILKNKETEEHMPSFRQFFSEWEARYPASSELLELMSYFLNFFLEQLNNGEKGALEQADEWYGKTVTLGWLLLDGKLSPEHFKNIIVIKCRLGSKQVAEARKFYTEWVDELTDNQEGLAAHYNDLLISFYEGKAIEVIPRLEELSTQNGIIKEDHFYLMDLKCLLLKAYFEALFTGMTDQSLWSDYDLRFENLNRAFQNFILRKKNKLSAQQIDLYTNFCKFISKLYATAYMPKGSKRNKKIVSLRQEIAEADKLLDRRWFVGMFARSFPEFVD